MRTNIEIDDKLMQDAMAASKATTKKAVVEEALQLMVQLKRQGEAIKSLWGIATWCGPDDDWFAPDPLDPGWADELKRRGIPGTIGADTSGPELPGSHSEVESSLETISDHGSR